MGMGVWRRRGRETFFLDARGLTFLVRVGVRLVAGLARAAVFEGVIFFLLEDDFFIRGKGS